MREYVIGAAAVYLLVMNLTALVMTCVDKRRAIKHRYRVSEASLLAVGALGGALLEYLTMQAIRHKTRHMKFMVSLPVFIVAHIAIIYLCLRFF